MRKVIALLLTASMILSVSLVALATDTTEKDLALLEDWANYMMLCEHCFGDILWVLDYVAAYAEEPTWDKLNCVCAAVCTAEQYMCKRIVPEYSTTDEDIMEYLENGFDLLNVTPSLSESSDILRNSLTAVRSLKNTLCTEAFWAPTVLQLGEHSAALRDYYVTLLRFADCETNYILGVLDKDEYYDELLTVRENYCPEMSRYGFEYFHDTSEIEKRGAELSDRLEECTVALTGAMNMSQAVLDDMTECIKSGNTEAISKRTLKLEGEKFFPMPRWNLDSQLVGTEDELNYSAMGLFLSGSLCYYFYEENGARVYYKEKESITTAPNGCVWTNISVTKEGFTSYLSECEVLGFMAAKIDEDGDSVTAYYLFDDYSVILSWENSQASFYFLDCPVYFADKLTLSFENETERS